MLRKVDQEKMKEWVDEQMEKLTPEQRLGQLVIPLYYMPDATKANLNSITLDIQEYHFGGALLSKGSMATHAKLVNRLQEVAQEEGLPGMMICIDGEWGLAMRLSDAIKYDRVGRITNSLVKPSCLIIDEIGRCTFDKHCTRLFFDIIDRRYAKEGSNTLICTSNLGPDKWGEFFSDDSALLCTLDRIFDDASVFMMKGESYRGRKV